MAVDTLSIVSANKMKQCLVKSGKDKALKSFEIERQCGVHVSYIKAAKDSELLAVKIGGLKFFYFIIYSVSVN